MIPALLPVYKRADIEFSHALGAYIFDVHGKQYLDFSAGYAAVALGHCNSQLVEALTMQAKKMWHISNKFKIPGLLEYCERLTKLSGFAGTTFIANAGAEAVECMIKMARRYFHAKGEHNKFRFITFEGAFHGRTMACISAGSAEKVQGFEPALDGFDRVPWNDLEAVKKALTKDTAGILIEPIQGEGGMRPCTKPFMKALEKLCKDNNILLLLDEVQCGMGRTGHMFAYQMYDIKPDLVALGKGLGSGFPISACLATEDVGKAMLVNTHGSTFGGNPLAVAVGSTVLDIMTAPNFLKRVESTSSYLTEKLLALKAKHSAYIDDIVGCGLMMGIKFKEGVDVDVVSAFCLEEYLLSTPASDNVLRITPPLIINESHCDEAIEKFDRAIQKLHNPGSILLQKLKKGIHDVKQKIGLSD